MSLSQTIAALEAETSDLEAVRAVKRLQHAYAHYADAQAWNDMADLFAVDGEAVLAEGRAQGRAEIAAHFQRVMGEGDSRPAPDRLNVRLFLSPVVTIAEDGSRTKARWHEVAMTGRYGQRADWAGGIHENEYVREGGVWKIAKLHTHPQYAGPYSPGWRNVAPDVPLVPYHYDPALAGTPTPRRALGDVTVLTESDAQHRLDELDARSVALIDESAVLNLQAAYGFYTDRKMWDDVADLFTPDATMEWAGEGAYVGRNSIRRALERFGPAGLRHGELNTRLQLDPVVTLSTDGRGASARVLELATLGQHGGASRWEFSILETSFAKEDEVWKIAKLVISLRFAADYDAGWAKDLLDPGAGPGQASPPDVAFTDGSACYPTQLGPAIAFAHPARDSMTKRIASATSASNESAVTEIKRKLAVARMHDGAENVACAYGYYIDEFRWDETADLFSEDGWKELSYIGTYIGRERVRESLFSRYGNRGRRPRFMAIHQKTQPYVTVASDGQTAQIRLQLFQINSADETDGSYIGGIYEEQIKIENGVFKIHGMDLDYVWLANYTGGWARIVPGSSQRFAPRAEDVKFEPDGPLRGVTFAPYPDIAPMGFHFKNPVSGRSPDVVLPWSDGRFG